MKKLLSLLAFCFAFIPVWAQDTTDTVEMADAMRNNGKIYVVIGVGLIILLGIVAYLVSMDIKLRKLEKKANKQ
jgi:hypothetical protein